MPKKFLLPVVFLGLVVMFSACGGNQSTIDTTLTPSPSETPAATATIASTASELPTAAPTATPIGTPIVVGPSNFPENVNPLTGLVVNDPTILNRRPVIVKVANYPRDGRPHAGLSYADIVFDYYIGEAMNRFAAVYYGQDAPEVGPVRSGRLIDIQLTNMYQANLVCVYADANYVWPDLVDGIGYFRIFSEGSNTFPALYRKEGIPKMENRVVANTAEITEWSVRRQVDDGTRYDLDGLAFDSRPPENAESADFVSVNYYSRNRAEWHYDPETGKYLRWIESIDDDNNMTMIPLIDRSNDQQLAFDNVVIMFVEYTEYSTLLHDAAISSDTDGGKAYIFRDGEVIEGRWRVTSRYRPLRFLYPDGEPIPFKPGQSWIYLLGNRSTVEQPEPGNWAFSFYLP